MKQKLERMSEVKDSYNFLVETICNKGLSYEQTKEALRQIGDEAFVTIMNDQEGLFDVQIGYTVFTIYQDGKNGFHIDNYASYFIPTDNGDGTVSTCFEEPISVELDKMKKDEVFDLFGLFCTERNKWKWYTQINDESITYLGFEAASEQETRECREVAESAYKLTKALTGYKLSAITEPKTSFVDFALGFNHTDFTSLDTKIRKVSAPTMNLKELMKIIVGEKDDPNWKKDIETVLGKMNSNVYLQPNCPMALHLLLPSDSVTVLEFDRRSETSDGTKITSADFEGLEHCFVCTTSNDYSFYVYIWDETATAYELAGGIDNFIKIIKNK